MADLKLKNWKQLTQAQKDEIMALESKFLPPVNKHTDHLKSIIGLDTVDKMAADAVLVSYYFREGVRAALAFGADESRKFIDAAGKEDLKPEDVKRSVDFLPNPSYPWETPG